MDFTVLKTHILIYNIPKTSRLKTNLQLVTCQSEYSDLKIDLRNKFYAPKNLYFDGSKMNYIIF